MTPDQAAPMRPPSRFHPLEGAVDDPATGRPVQRTLWAPVSDGAVPGHVFRESIRQRLERLRKDFQAIQADVEYIGRQPGRARLRSQLRQLLIDFDPHVDPTEE